MWARVWLCSSCFAWTRFLGCLIPVALHRLLASLRPPVPHHSLSAFIMHFSLPSTQTFIRNPASTRAAVLAVIPSDNGEPRLREPANDALLVLLPLLIVL